MIHQLKQSASKWGVLPVIRKMKLILLLQEIKGKQFIIRRISDKDTPHTSFFFTRQAISNWSLYLVKNFR